jgi:uncharacterized protein
MEAAITYFETTGVENTGATLALAKRRALEVGAAHVVVASTTGATAREAMGVFAGTGISLVVVPHQRGFRDQERFDMEVAAALESGGHRVYWGTMLFHTGEFYGNDAASALANLLRTFGQGMKVCLEILMMAADGGAVTRGEQVVVVAGTGRGADTAVLATASTSNRVKEVRIHEILCKPRLAQ